MMCLKQRLQFLRVFTNLRVFTIFTSLKMCGLTRFLSHATKIAQFDWSHVTRHVTRHVTQATNQEIHHFCGVERVDFLPTLCVAPREARALGRASSYKHVHRVVN